MFDSHTSPSRHLISPIQVPAITSGSLAPRLLFCIVLLGLILIVSPAAQAEYCWIYDDQQAYTKFSCSGPIPTNQTVEEKHNEWHSCFGAIGTSSPQPFRGQRFIAFHRQMIQEFNIDRAITGFDKIETWDASQGLRFTLPYPSCSFGSDRLCDNNGDGDCVDAVDDIVLCEDCSDLPACFTVNTTNTTPCNPFGYTNLDQFANADEIGIALDAGSSAWHASFHGGIGDADGDPTTPGVQACTDIDSTSSATGEPMFWRAHQKLDDVLTDWQVRNAVDIVLVIDRSGSMSATVPDGDTKLQKAVEASKLFGAMVRGSTNSIENRIGLVSFSSTATNEMGLTNSTAAISADGTSGTLITELNGISTGGATSIGSGIENAMCMLCPDSDSDGDCDSGDCLVAPGNPRKAILILSDGLENTQPCLEGSDAPCVGTEINYEGTPPLKSLGYTQMCAVGYGEETALDGDLLNALAEQQGGIYISGATGNDLKEFYAKCYGELTPEFLSLDPKGVLAPDQLASKKISHNTCQDSAATFVLGWQQKLAEGDISLEIRTPSGQAVDLSDAAIRSDIDSTWHFAKLALPYNGEGSGQWNARVVRPHRSFVNGFVSDAFIDHKAGIDIVRTEIQRLCTDKCKHVLYYEDGSATGISVYADALKAEQNASVISVTHASGASDFNAKLSSDQQWDLVVYANQLKKGVQPFDAALQRNLCRQNQASIVTDNRESKITAPLFKCLNAARDGTKNMDRIVGDGRLADSFLKLENTGYKVFSYGLASGGPGDAQILFYDRMFSKGLFSSMIRGEHDPKQHKRPPSAAVVASGRSGKQVDWFANIMSNGHSRLDPHKPRSNPKTGDVLKPSVRITESFRPIGGYDKVVAKVEITPPDGGVGNILMKYGATKGKAVFDGDPQSARETAFRNQSEHDSGHAHSKTYPLFDDGTHGDNFPDNHYWTAEISNLSTIDGNYTYRFIVDVTKDGCTQRREVAQTVYVDVGVDPGRSPVQVERGFGSRWELTIMPRDQYGNYWGPGRPGKGICNSTNCEVGNIADNGDGSYTINIKAVPPAVSVSVNAFGTTFNVPLRPTDSGVNNRVFWFVTIVLIALIFFLWWLCCRRSHNQKNHG
jgi:hypothetical protein